MSIARIPWKFYNNLIHSMVRGQSGLRPKAGAGIDRASVILCILVSLTWDRTLRLDQELVWAYTVQIVSSNAQLFAGLVPGRNVLSAIGIIG
jgi:hypothetical protein